MKKRLFALAAAAVMVLGLTACGGGSNEGRTGDTMETYFFDFTVNSAYLTSDYAGYTPAEGNVLLVADITVKNTFQQSLCLPHHHGHGDLYRGGSGGRGSAAWYILPGRG